VHSLDHKLEHLVATWLPDQRVTISESAVDALERAGISGRVNEPR